MKSKLVIVDPICMKFILFSMEFFKYRPMPANVQKEVVEERKQAELAAAK